MRVNVSCLMAIFLVSTAHINSSSQELNSSISNMKIYKSYANDNFGELTIDHLPLKNNVKKKKRNVLNLYNVISCATKCNPLSYKGYGCYCGFLGSGFPVDGIDLCCHQHDLCYNEANCPFYLEYFIPYYWMCINDIPHCPINRNDIEKHNSCSLKLCECDRNLSICLRRFRCPQSRAVCETSAWRYVQNLFMNF